MEAMPLKKVDGDIFSVSLHGKSFEWDFRIICTDEVLKL